MEKKMEDKESLDDPLSLSDKAKVIWHHDRVQHLAKLVGEHWGHIQNGHKRKRVIWKDIAAALSEEDFRVSGLECDRKWRNLKTRYLAIREKQLNGEKVGLRVDYFKTIHSFLKDDVSVQSYLRNRCASNSKDKRKSDARKEPFPKGNVRRTTVWTDKSVNLLLRLLIEFKDWFTEKEVERDDNALWEAISEQMKLGGHTPDPEDCHEKWSSLATTYEFHKSESEATGTLPIWPYYTQVRHIINTIGMPFGGSPVSNDSPKKKKRYVSRFGREVLTPPIKSEVEWDEGTDETPCETGMESEVAEDRLHVSRGQWQELNRRLQKIEGNMEVCKRIDRLEEKLTNNKQLLEAQQQTNMLLGHVLSELSRLSRNLTGQYPQGHPPADSNDLGSAITIVVPETSIP